jgi:hypothetical protein
MPIAEGLIVWVGYRQGGVRYEGKFFYAGEAFLDRREFLGPITPELFSRSVVTPAPEAALIKIRVAAGFRSG